MSEICVCNFNLKLVASCSKLTITWHEPSTSDDCCHDGLALIVVVKFVPSGLHWSTKPLSDPKSPFSLDISSLSSAVRDTQVQISAQLAVSLPGTPRGWKIVAKTAVITADNGSSRSSSDEDYLADLFFRWQCLSSSSTSFLLPLSDISRAKQLRSSAWLIPPISVKFVSPVQVVIKWKHGCQACHNSGVRLPDHWMIKLTRTVIKKKKTSKVITAYFYTLDGRTSKQKLPVCLMPLTEYTVGVTPVFSCSCSLPVSSHWTSGESTTTATFTVPAAAVELTLSDLQALFSAAVNYCSQSGSAVCNWLYRNRSYEYFSDIMSSHNGIMKVYKKDNSGDPASPINGKIDGLFFMAKNANGFPPRYSYFGPLRLQVPANVMLCTAPNLYFADFYCMQGSIHQVTLVMTKPGSASDNFCRAKLLPLSLTDNPFFFHSCGRLYTRNMKKLEVELLYTENVDIGGLLLRHGAVFSTAITKGRGHSRPEGIPKNPKCLICNVGPPQSLVSSKVKCATF